MDENVKEQIHQKQTEVWKETISAKPNLKHLIAKTSHKSKAASTLECNKVLSDVIKRTGRIGAIPLYRVYKKKRNLGIS